MPTWTDDSTVPDSETPLPNPDPNASLGGSPVGLLGSPHVSLAEETKTDRLGLNTKHRVAWAAAALVCAAAGIVGSLLGAHTVAHTDANRTRAAFKQTSTGVAAASTASIQREEDLALDAATFFAAHPKASPAQFAAWNKWTHPLRSYPELERLGLVTIVRAPELAAFKARLGGRTLKPTPRPTSPRPASASKHSNTPSSGDSFHCYALAGLARGIAKYPPAGLDYCTQISGLLASRDSGARSSLAVATGSTQALAVETPVYASGVPPTTAAHRGAFVGWLHEVLAPGIILQRALRGHPASAAQLSYRIGSSSITSTSGTPPAGAQRASIGLRGGWSLTVFGSTASAGVLGDGPALALLIVGVLLSVLLGLVVYLLGTAHEPEPVEEQVELHEDLYDALTGLPNRALTLDLAERVIARTGRQSGMLAGALLIDIDWFKDVNEKLGQTAGDQALKIVVDRLESVVRAGDTVGRLGGDQFVILVESQARGIKLDSLARRVIEALHTPVELEGFGPSFFLTASIGVAFGRYVIADDLLRDARLALLASKAAGKDRYTLFNANMRSVTEGHGMLEVDLNAALAEQQFLLEYAPIYELGSERVAALEVLLRWQHPRQGVLEPSEFMTLAEETGLIVPIGRWVLEQACNRAAAWSVAGHRISVSVTVSATQLNRDGFVTDVRRALQQSGVDPSLLTLAIDEDTVMLDIESFAARAAEIRALGVRIAIDNFGNSYAHRAALAQAPLDFLKIDRSSLATSEDEDYRSWLWEAILHFGNEISATVVAKGVDTAEQASSLRTIGCTMAQGAFAGEPLAAEAVESLLEGTLLSVQASPTGS
jgi:diguanylate cyclase (GGDEF)-like protein